MDTHFAPPERAADEQIRCDVGCISHSPVVDGLMSLAGGLMAVLNEHRQILAVNHKFLDGLGIRDVDLVLGLRPGEAIQCIHADDMPGGCGTSEFCATCGAAIAIVSALASNVPQERKCVAAVSRNGRPEDFCFSVRACPITVSGRTFVLLFLHDITREQQWSSLERVFFHDVSNTVCGLVGKSELLITETDTHALAREVRELSARLAREVEIQKSLFRTGPLEYRPTLSEVPAGSVTEELSRLFAHHTAAEKRRLVFPEVEPSLMIRTDTQLLIRVLGNMITNALEATDPGGEVRLSLEANDRTVTFCVWNQAAIPADVQKRVFQRNYTTKDGLGRGLGTYSMKLIGEGMLGGNVSFTSSPECGTEFRFMVNR